ncbi:MAG: hypothetical protein LBF78_08345 [Treponema sp.]|jgi:hypothetical protein|nr:hypothetical protein [Treponema sp.]
MKDDVPDFCLSDSECKALFALLKKNEEDLNAIESSLLYRLEKTLYSILSIQEVEELISEPVSKLG